ncbi:sigma-54 dependent transcriptional regulator [Aquamicrobium sp. LC103]|uniref:sigma-54-dependent transcriptional regulator n=1 Tax=Aquamicrobium sp. LC103 TaxID=1120658 RepID=UPI00063EBA8C|nr:sigma-54 dependent transcriptional regulator [Aquamicrobium sp. LC103]TKT76740.1 sigma-54-dependent Fis family transcriptional regulator [Aquamicrobium sp. LC103]
MNRKARVLFVDDDPAMRESVEQFLRLAGFTLTIVASGKEALSHLSADYPGIVATDLRMPGMTGAELLEQAQAIDPELPVVVITGHGDIETAVEMMRRGAYDFIEKPFDPARFSETLSRAAEKRRLVLENRRLRQAASDGALAGRILGTSRAAQDLRDAVAEIAATDVSVVLHGETGVGKDLVARAIHEASGRADGNFVAINCAAIPETMVESELFGHEQGAFTGAVRARMGKIEHADGGTLFLDEVESMPLAMQAKLLRALQDHEVERLGSNRIVPVDLRTIAASKTDLVEAGRAGTFRSDLFYRLAVVELRIPPLRERKDDLLLLFEHFVARAAEAHGREPKQITAPVAATLMANDWPGNVRELRNAAERYALGFSKSIAVDPLAPPEGGRPGRSLAERVETFERSVIERSLARAGGSIMTVMEELQIPRRTLNEKMARHGLSRPGQPDDTRQDSAD